MVISRHVWQYTRNDEPTRSYIGQNVFDFFESKCNEKLSEHVLKLSFEPAIRCASFLKRYKSVCSQAMKARIENGKSVFFPEPRYNFIAFSKTSEIGAVKSERTVLRKCAMYFQSKIVLISQAKGRCLRKDSIIRRHIRRQRTQHSIDQLARWFWEHSKWGSQTSL